MTDPKRSLRVPASPRAEASVSASARFCPRLSSVFLPRNFALCALSVSLGCSLSLTAFSALSLCLPLCISFSLPCLCLSGLAIRFVCPAQFVCKSLAPCKLSYLPSRYGTADPQREGGPQSSRPTSSPTPSRLGPVGPARSHLISPAAPPPPLPSTRAATGSGVLNRVSRAPDSGPRAP